MNSRNHVAGLTLPEIMVALLLGLFIVHLGLGALARLDSARGRIAARTDLLVATRVSRHVLRTELGYGVPGVDWQVAGDSVSLRAFRGTAVVCLARPATPSLQVSFSGNRAPDPTKDSLLLLTERGERAVRALVDVAAAVSPCAGSDSTRAATWRLDLPPPPGTVLARLFEHGAYYVSARALRYRRGASGRQPLTPEVFSAATRWTAAPDRVGVELRPLEPATGGGWSGVLAWVSGR